MHHQKAVDKIVRIGYSVNNEYASIADVVLAPV